MCSISQKKNKQLWPEIYFRIWLIYSCNLQPVNFYFCFIITTVCTSLDNFHWISNYIIRICAWYLSALQIQPLNSHFHSSGAHILSKTPTLTSLRKACKNKSKNKVYFCITLSLIPNTHFWWTNFLLYLLSSVNIFEESFIVSWYIPQCNIRYFFQFF